MFTLLVMSKSRFFTEWFSQATVSVGRALDNDVVLPALNISRTHCLIQTDQEAFWVEDLNSTNGCAVNGSVVTGRAALRPYDELRIGSYTLYLQQGRCDIATYLGKHSSRANPEPAMDSRPALPKIRSSRASTERNLVHRAPARRPLPTRAVLRRLIDLVLVSWSDFDAFCLDHFPHIRARFAANMDRVQQATILLELAQPCDIMQHLREDYPDLKLDTLIS